MPSPSKYTPMDHEQVRTTAGRLVRRAILNGWEVRARTRIDAGVDLEFWDHPSADPVEASLVPGQDRMTQITIPEEQPLGRCDQSHWNVDYLTGLATPARSPRPGPTARRIELATECANLARRAVLHGWDIYASWHRNTLYSLEPDPELRVQFTTRLDDDLSAERTQSRGGFSRAALSPQAARHGNGCTLAALKRLLNQNPASLVNSAR